MDVCLLQHKLNRKMFLKRYAVCARKSHMLCECVKEHVAPQRYSILSMCIGQFDEARTPRLRFSVIESIRYRTSMA